MSKRLVQIAAVLLLAGLVELGWHVTVRQRSPTPPGRRRVEREGPPPEAIPYRPRATPPRAARLTGAQAISYASPTATADSLRAMMQGANVMVVVLDAARADHFGCYGYPRDTTPNLDRLAQQGLVFEQHFCQYPQTTASTASLMTGQYPDTHGLVGAVTSADAYCQTIDPSTLTLAQALEKAGYQTLLFSSNHCASPHLGIGDDFQEAVLVERPRQTQPEQRGRKQTVIPSAPALVESVASRLADGEGPPFFAYLHFLPPHKPYEAPESMLARYRRRKPPNYWQGEPAFTRVWERPRGEAPAHGVEWVNLYDANLRWADQAVGDLITAIKKAGVWENTLFIVTADHGEALEEHRYAGHVSCPYDEAIQIPLVVKFPGAHGPVGRVRALTQTIDLMPTILDLVQAGNPSARSGSHPPQADKPRGESRSGSLPGVQGQSLVPLLTGTADKVHDFVFCRTAGRWPCYVVRDQHTALFLYQGGEMRALYDLDRDPWQSHNLISEQPNRAGALVRAFESFARTQKAPPLEFVAPGYKSSPRRDLPTRTLSEETRRELRALGYVK